MERAGSPTPQVSAKESRAVELPGAIPTGDSVRRDGRRAKEVQHGRRQFKGLEFRVMGDG